MGRLWSIIEEWRDTLDFPPSYRQIAGRMGVVQSTFDGWKDPVDVPKRANLYAISKVTGTPYHVVVQAAIDDADLFNAKAAQEAFEARAPRVAGSTRPPRDGRRSIVREQVDSEVRGGRRRPPAKKQSSPETETKRPASDVG